MQDMLMSALLQHRLRWFGHVTYEHHHIQQNIGCLRYLWWCTETGWSGLTVESLTRSDVAAIEQQWYSRRQG